MVHIDEFYAALERVSRTPNEEQREVIDAPASDGLFIVAGPGSGKTTCLTLRVLKMIMVEGVAPSGVIATTFTVKAAEELRSRILGWGFRIIDVLKAIPKINKEKRAWLDTIDINQVWTGTLDSLCEEILRDHRIPGAQPPVLADEYVSRTLMLRHALFQDGQHKNTDLQSFLWSTQSDSDKPYNFYPAAKVGVLKSIWDRRFMDRVGWEQFKRSGPLTERDGRKAVDLALSNYEKALSDDKRHLVDFALLEERVRQYLDEGKLGEFLGGVEVILVDEYQDSNLLQEQIYFAIAKACQGALCVVGDDDQSLYRFRGATVNLFTDFGKRYKKAFRRDARQVYLLTNYRSTKSIVDFVNGYASLDASYQMVRVKGKPPLSPRPNAPTGRPVLAMFRQSREALAEDLASFIHSVFRGKGFTAKGVEKIICDPKAGDVGDCALLCSSPADYSSGGNPRLPLLLAQRLSAPDMGIQVFNPRGQDFSRIELAQLFGGLLAICIDPDAAVQQGGAYLFHHGTGDTLLTWRAAAEEFIRSRKAPKGMRDYVEGWKARDPRQTGKKWPNSVTVVNLIYGLVHYLPVLHDSAEGQLYLEVFTRQLSACEQVGKFSGKLVHAPNNPSLSEASIKELLRDFLGPVAAGAVQIDEELVTSFPRDQLSVLSIHQSKGLEFPLTIVDVGSDFDRDHHTQAFKRYPKDGGVPHRMEDIFRQYSPLEADARSRRDRAFDDLYRQYFVAFSRPQDVLLLVGLNGCLPTSALRNVATGWDRNGTNHWATKVPFTLI